MDNAQLVYVITTPLAAGRLSTFFARGLSGRARGSPGAGRQRFSRIDRTLADSGLLPVTPKNASSPRGPIGARP